VIIELLFAKGDVLVITAGITHKERRKLFVELIKQMILITFSLVTVNVSKVDVVLPAVHMEGV